MNYLKIIKIVLFGNLFVSFPIYFSCFIVWMNSYEAFRLKNLCITLAFCSLYWCIISPVYKLYSIKLLDNSDEYFTWKRFSINSLLLYPDNFVGTKFEFWDDEKFQSYQARKNKLINFQ